MSGLYQKLILFGILLLKAKAYEQNDYNLTSERIEVIDSDPKYLVANSKNFKYNRTLIVSNLTFSLKRDFYNDMQFHIQGYKFVSNEYRLFPMSFERNICESLGRNEFGIHNVYNCGNFTSCPILKGNYVVCNWTPDESKFPPYVPSGRYMIDVVWVWRSRTVSRMQWYCKVEKRMIF